VKIIKYNIFLKGEVMKKDNYKTYIELNTDVLSFIGYMVDNYGKVVALELNYPKSKKSKKAS